MKLQEVSQEKKWKGIYKGCEIEVICDSYGWWVSIWNEKEEFLVDNGLKGIHSLEEARKWAKKHIDNNFIEFRG